MSTLLWTLCGWPGVDSERGVSLRLCVYVCVFVDGCVYGGSSWATVICRLFHSSVSAVLVVEWPLVGGGGWVLAASGDSPFTLGFSGVSGGGLRGATETRVFPWFS